MAASTSHSAATCNLWPVLSRKPLLACEQDAAPRKVLVTGGTGYIGSRVVERLLATGNSVVVLCLPWEISNDTAEVRLLKSFAGAADWLHLMSGDILDGNSIKVAMAGCQAVVHLVAVVDLVPPQDPVQFQRFLDLPLKGTAHVLAAAIATPTVSKVVMTSSIAAILSDYWERGRDHVYTEDDWCMTQDKAHMTYHYVKREQEKLAYELAKGARWSLATVNPGVVFGPVLCATHAITTSPKFIKMQLDGSTGPFQADTTIVAADLDDVAAALCGLLAKHEATGRHIIVNGYPSILDLNACLRTAYPHASVPYITLPGFIMGLLAWLAPQRMAMNYTVFKATNHKPFTANSSKIQKVLGLSFIDWHQSLLDAAKSLDELGLIHYH
eukprot:jgi/Chrzof1/3124/Cz12g12250.t1